MSFSLIRWLCNILLFSLFYFSADTASNSTNKHLNVNDTSETVITSRDAETISSEDIITFKGVLFKLLEDFRNETVEEIFQEKRCQEHRANSGREVIIVDSEVGKEITLTSLLYKEAEPWSACRRSCLTSRVRECRLKNLCSVDVRVEEAYCYVPGSKCEKKVTALLSKAQQGSQGSQGSQTTKEAGTEEPEILHHRNEQEKNEKEFTESVYYDYSFIVHPNEADDGTYDLPDYRTSDHDEEESNTTANDTSVDGSTQDRRRPVAADECGTSTAKVPFQMFRIIGGRDAIKDSWPWQVAIFNRFQELFCGGTLISSRWVLTAAHCIKKKIHVRVGEHNIAFPEDGEIEIKVEKSFKHPDFDRETIDNDIGLLKLSEDAFQKTKRSRKACLPAQAQALPRESQCVVLGWGKEKLTHIFGSDVLQYVKVPILGWKACQRDYSSFNLTKNMFCAGALRADACEGDSGGPLLCQDNHERWVVIGITSFGEGCGDENRLGVYTRVSKYVDWIQETIRKYSLD